MPECIGFTHLHKELINTYSPEFSQAPHLSLSSLGLFCLIYNLSHFSVALEGPRAKMFCVYIKEI